MNRWLRRSPIAGDFWDILTTFWIKYFNFRPQKVSIMTDLFGPAFPRFIMSCRRQTVNLVSAWEPLWVGCVHSHYFFLNHLKLKNLKNFENFKFSSKLTIFKNVWLLKNIYIFLCNFNDNLSKRSLHNSIKLQLKGSSQKFNLESNISIIDLKRSRLPLAFSGPLFPDSLCHTGGKPSTWFPPEHLGG